ncbi:caspase family protein [Streptomyces sp. NPDC008313]|uniref:caspase family protein n=1 Tax=Streptomyces sp. NPDC008313 TaxID=3364826 RepID=UPI0036E11C4D
MNRALLVGVSRYDVKAPADPHGVPGDLRAVEHNVARLGEALVRGGVFAEDEVTRCAPSGVDEFNQALNEAVAGAEGLLLFYFAGHGAVPSAGDELWLQMRNAMTVPGDKAVFQGAWPFSSVLTVLATARARQVVVILDCCNAGNAAQIWDTFRDADRQAVSLLMSVQANSRIDAGDDATPTPFTAELVRLLTEDPDGDGTGTGEGADGTGTGDGPDDGLVTFAGLAEALRERLPALGLLTLRAESWQPQSRPAPSGEDVILADRTTPAPDRTTPAPGHPEPAPGPPAPAPRPPAAPVRPRPRAALAALLRAARAPRPPWPRSRRAVPGVSVRPSPRKALGLLPRGALGRAGAAAVAVALLAGLGVAVRELVADSGAPCRPPLELRLLTDPDLEPTVRKAADTYLTSDANRTADGCRRSGITVYGAGAADAVNGFHEQADPWQEPRGDDVNPQRDVGPQPDIWIPATSASVTRAAQAPDKWKWVTLDADSPPFAYSPMVLAVPQNIAAERVGERTGRSLAGLVADLRERDADADVRRTDPEFTDSALLATAGLYGADGGGAVEPGAVGAGEQRVAQPGPPAPTGADLLCALPDDDTVDRRTAALVPEFLLRSGVSCDRSTRTPRMAAYPDDVPALDPVFVHVSWYEADRDTEARGEAVRRFEEWLTGGEGLAVFGQDGFRSPRGDHAPLDPGGPGAGVLRAPGGLPAPASAGALDSALTAYRKAGGPGRVLFLLDSSGSMGDLWDGPGGGPGIVRQAFAGLGDEDEYGVWAVAAQPGGRGTHSVLLPFGRHARGEAEQTLERGAAVREVEADPYAALTAALEEMDRRGGHDDRPQLIVYVTDDEDNDHLGGERMKDLLAAAGKRRIPVVVAALDSGGCDRGKPDARISAASGGRCLDTKTDVVAGLRDEVARTGTGDK